MQRKPFTPWRGDQKRSFLLLYLLPSLLAAGAYLMPEARYYAAGTAVLSILIGWRLRDRVKARQHGQEIEATFVSRAIPELQRAGFRVEAGRMTRVGDIDLIVARQGWTATVEIKSFRYWRGRLRDRSRQQQARAQARRQCAAIGAHVAVIWLPKAWPNWLTRLLNWLIPERDPVIVMGSARWLAKELSRKAPR